MEDGECFTCGKVYNSQDHIANPCGFPVLVDNTVSGDSTYWFINGKWVRTE